MLHLLSINKMKSKTSNRKPRNRIAIFYKSHGEYIGPYWNITLSKNETKTWRENGAFAYLSNYILKSPLQLRRRVG